MRDFDEWFKTFGDTIATWKYYTDFNKVYQNVEKIKDELNILNGLVGVDNQELEFRRIVEKFPCVIKVLPILIAKREHEIKFNAPGKKYLFNFKNPNYSVDEYVMFMENTGLFDLLRNHIIHSLIDYVTGVEVGMDTNGRKSRTGDAMEDLVEGYIKQAGFVKNNTYYKEMTIPQITEKWGIDLSAVSNNGKTIKRFDFVVKTDAMLYVIETNFYSAQGSKPNETARSYKQIAQEIAGIENVCFVWFTDGKGWKASRHNLEETYDVMEHIYNIKDLENGIISEVFK